MTNVIVYPGKDSLPLGYVRHENHRSLVVPSLLGHASNGAS